MQIIIHFHYFSANCCDINVMLVTVDSIFNKGVTNSRLVVQWVGGRTQNMRQKDVPDASGSPMQSEG